MTMNRMCRNLAFAFLLGAVLPSAAADWPGFTRGMGIGGWLTNYKRFNVLPTDRRLILTEGDYEHFDSYITERDVANIRAMGFDHIRLGFDQIVLEEAPGRWRERTFRRLDDFVGWCAKHGLGCVLNLHKAVGNYCDIEEKVQLLDDRALQDRFIALWLEMERRYHGQPKLVFELLNEVRDVDPNKWNALADRAIREIRAKNPDRWIVVGPTCWNNPPALAKLKVWKDPRVVYTFHMYWPNEFTHQRGVLQWCQLAYNRELEYPSADPSRYSGYYRFHGWGDPFADGLPVDRARLAAYLKPCFDFVNRHPDKILWNGEFGTIRHAPKASRVAYMRDVVSLCQSHGIPWCVWNYLSTPNDGNRFSLVDDDTRRILSPELLAACLGTLPRQVGVAVPKGAGEAAGRALAAACGLPVGEGPVTILAGTAADGFGDVALSNLLVRGGVMLDASAAVAVSRRGLSHLIGVEATAGVPAGTAGEAFLLESAAPEGSPVAPVAGKGGATLKLLRGAEALAEFRTADGKALGPSMTRALTGRGWKIVCATPRIPVVWTRAHRQSFVAHAELAAGEEIAAAISCDALFPADAASSPRQMVLELAAAESSEELHLSVRPSGAASFASLPVRLSTKWRGATLDGNPLKLRDDGAFVLPGPFAPVGEKRFVFRAAPQKPGESRALVSAPQLADPRSWWYDCFLFARDKAAATHDSASVVFLGDSITQLFEGNAVWNAHFAQGPYRAANFGICGDRTEHLLMRLRGGMLDYADPKWIVLLIGTNNIGHRSEPAEETAAAIAECVRLVRMQRPKAKLILSAIFPRSLKASDPVRAKVDAVNALIRPLADGRDVLWLDMRDDYLEKDGTLPKALFPDGLHPSEAGYARWVSRLRTLMQTPAEAALVEKMRREVAAGRAAVLAKDGRVVRTLEGRGIRPLLETLEKTPGDLKGAVAYDKVVGRAAAAIYVVGGTREVRADVMSRGAFQLLAQHGIAAASAKVVGEIINRKGDGICPMERAVGGLSVPKEMVTALQSLDRARR